MNHPKIVTRKVSPVCGLKKTVAHSSASRIAFVVVLCSI
jgi:hypothetical protein